MEYGVIIAVVVAALVAMQTYFKRGLQGRIRQASDDIGEQFSPGYTEAHHVTDSTVNSTEVVADDAGGAVTTYTNSTQQQDRAGNETVDIFTNEYWVH